MFAYTCATIWKRRCSPGLENLSLSELTSLETDSKSMIAWAKGIEKRILMRIYGSKSDENEEWRRLYNEELHSFLEFSCEFNKIKYNLSDFGLNLTRTLQFLECSSEFNKNNTVSRIFFWIKQSFSNFLLNLTQQQDFSNVFLDLTRITQFLGCSSEFDKNNTVSRIFFWI